MSVELLFRLLWPATAMLSGIAMMLVPHWYRARAQARHEARLAARMARGTDLYFEELRSLKAYPPPVRALVWRGFGFAFIFMGALEIYKIVTD
jgi:Flp pilus assembly protein TadB